MMKTPWIAILTSAIPLMGLIVGPAPAAASFPGSGSKAMAEIQWRWIGIKANPQQPCPIPNGSWATEGMFPDGLDSNVKLSRYCIFTFNSARPVAAQDLLDLAQLVPNQLLEIEPDIMGVASFAGPNPSNVDPSLWQPLYRHFLQQAGRVHLDQVPGYAPVRLAVIDTHPTAEINPFQLPSNSQHGATLLNMAQRLLCDDEDSIFFGGCVTHLTSRLALSYVTFDPSNPADSEQDLVMGGFVGTLADLAVAIQQEVVAWKLAGVPQQRLVLNLSIGWNPTFGGTEVSANNMPLPARAVYEAIEDAACQGVAIVAATGNRTGGPSSSIGPMMPAGWATRQALDSSGCAQLVLRELTHKSSPTGFVREDFSGGYIDAGKSAVTGTRPLLFAAGGSVSDGQPLPNSRDLSLPERLAIGDHGVVDDYTNTDTPTAILTGSSVSTLVVSAAAAATWYYAPEWSGEQILWSLDAAGEPLGFAADFCFQEAPNCPIVRRVSVCAAVASVCSQLNGICQPVPCQAWSPHPPDLNDNLASLVPTLQLDLESIQYPYSDSSICEPSKPYFDPANGPATDPCPDRQYESVEATPWLHPQPGTYACPPCRVHQGSGQLIVEIDESFVGTLSDPTLDLCGQSYSLGAIPLDPGASTIVDNVDLDGCTEPTVSFTVTNNGATGSSISSAMIVN